MPTAAYAQGPARPGLSAVKPPVDGVKQFADTISSIIAYPLYAAAATWNYVIDHTGAAALLTATIAGTIAINSIKATRAIARLRETSASYSKDNWDEDVIKARNLYSEIKRSCVNKPQDVAAFFEQLPVLTFEDVVDEGERAKRKQEHDTKRIWHEGVVVTLRTIMNDYENKALGIRLGILDETYAYRYSRGSIITDWQILNPLVAMYRLKQKNPQLYLEFEGLANAWALGRSFSSGKKLRISRKRTIFR